MTFKRLLSASICAALLTVLSGCAITVPLQRHQIDTFRNGDSSESAKAKVGKSTPTLEHQFTHKGRRYLAQHFNLQTGTTQSGTVVCTPTCIYIPITVPVFAPFVMVYEGGGASLRAFGTLEELSKDPDEAVSDLMPELKASMQRAQAEKKKS